MTVTRAMLGLGSTYRVHNFRRPCDQSVTLLSTTCATRLRGRPQLAQPRRLNHRHSASSCRRTASSYQHPALTCVYHCQASCAPGPMPRASSSKAAAMQATSHTGHEHHGELDCMHLHACCHAWRQKPGQCMIQRSRAPHLWQYCVHTPRKRRSRRIASTQAGTCAAAIVAPQPARLSACLDALRRHMRYVCSLAAL